MAKCRATTQKGLPCRRAATKGSRYCSTHGRRPNKDLSRDKLLADLVDFAGKATNDLLTLDVMKAQYCSAKLPKNIKAEMKDKERVLRRILYGHDKHPEIPGLIRLLNDPQKIRSDDLVSMRRKFGGIFRELTALIVKHCKVKATHFTLPELRISLKLGKKDTGCNDIPEVLKEWLEDEDEATGRDKQVLCLATEKGERVNLPVGFLLPDDFVVMHNVDNGKWYGVARRSKETENWSQPIWELLKHKRKDALVALVRGLWNTILTTAVPLLALWALRRLLVVVMTAALTGSKWLLLALPRHILAACYRFLRHVRTLVSQYLRTKPAQPSPSTAVALWFGNNLAAETCPFIPQLTAPAPLALPLPSGSARPMIAPPPGRLATVLTGNEDDPNKYLEIVLVVLGLGTTLGMAMGWDQALLDAAIVGKEAVLWYGSQLVGKIEDGAAKTAEAVLRFALRMMGREFNEGVKFVDVKIDDFV